MLNALVILTLHQQALFDICSKISKATDPRKGTTAAKLGTGITDKPGEGRGATQNEGKPFANMNNIVANLLLNLTRYFSV